MGDSNNIKQLFNSLFSEIDEDLNDFKPLKAATSSSAIRPSHIFLGTMVLILFVGVVTNYLAHFLITLFSMIYPAYMSFKVQYNCYSRQSIKEMYN